MAFAAPDRTRIRVGTMLLGVAIACGLVLLTIEFLIPPFFEADPMHAYTMMALGAVLAFPAAAVYLAIPRLLDRYDPEPWSALLGALAWGGIVACGLSAFINSSMANFGVSLGGAKMGDFAASIVSAPLVEELCKGLGVWGFFYFLRRQFDGVVDGVVYATFIGLGFATVENVIYYAKAAHTGDDTLALTFLLRGILSPWVHPLFTSMTGVGLGIARQDHRPIVRVGAPLAGFLVACGLHLIWNTSATLVEGWVFMAVLPLWIVLVGAFLALIAMLVRRKGQLMRLHLEEEVQLGIISKEELDLVCSAFGLVRARYDHGPIGEDLVRTTARLGLHKWHASRAERHAQHSISPAFIQPLRLRISGLRRDLAKERGERLSLIPLPKIELEPSPFPDRAAIFGQSQPPSAPASTPPPAPELSGNDDDGSSGPPPHTPSH